MKISMSKEEIADIMGWDLVSEDFLQNLNTKVINLIREAEKRRTELCALEAEWCINNYLEHQIPERIRRLPLE